MKITKIQDNESIQFTPVDSQKCYICHGNRIFYENNTYICMDCNSKANQECYMMERKIEWNIPELKIPFTLSSRQKAASDYFVELFKNHQDGKLLAVCGAGKTEIMYGVIYEALLNKKKVCFAIPRKEIVKELYQRIKPIFPNTVIKALYESSYDDSNAPLLISTVHQLLHYESEFDLIIIDEVDAFPFKDNKYLERLVNKSLVSGGVKILMSATMKKRKDTYLINRRHHLGSLDKPKIVLCDDFLEKTKEIIALTKEKNRKLIIYVPRINDAISLSNILNIECVSSKEKNIKEIIDDFRKGASIALVSTTVLERGVTFKYLDVLVYNAEHDVFNKETLIQIAGRVGRSKDDKNGNIYFLAKRNMVKFLSVIGYVKKMNRDNGYDL